MVASGFDTRARIGNLSLKEMLSAKNRNLTRWCFAAYYGSRRRVNKVKRSAGYVNIREGILSDYYRNANAIEVFYLSVDRQ